MSKIRSPEVKSYLLKNFNKIFYRIKPDIQVFINGDLKISIECKAYTENAMIKRILVDCTLIKQIFPNVSFVLLQLESQFGGDYSHFTTGKFGSPSTHTLFSYFDVELNIITLLRGERKVDQPIHKREFFKPLTIEALKEAVFCIKNLINK